MQQRRDEILAKKAKLAELKRQRELRATQNGPGRPSFSGSDVRNIPRPLPSPVKIGLKSALIWLLTGKHSWSPRRLPELTIVERSSP